MAVLALAAGFTPVQQVTPELENFRMQAISKAGAQDWPFVAESGHLMCTYVLGDPQVYFVPDNAPDMNRAFHLDVNIMAMSIVNLGMTDVLLPYDNSEQLLARLVPLITLGQRLCKQPPGTMSPGAEL